METIDLGDSKEQSQAGACSLLSSDEDLSRALNRDHTRSCLMRERYLRNLGMFRLCVHSYVPNLEVFLTEGTHQLPPLERVRAARSIEAAELCADDDDLEENERKPFFGAGSIRSSVVNVSSATLGAGALALPCAFRNSGIIAGLIVMILLGWLATISIKFIIQAIEESNHQTYEELAFHAFGRKFAYFMEANMIFFCFGTAVGYMITVGDLSSDTVSLFAVKGEWYSFLFSKTFIMLVITIGVLLPLSCLDSINKLRFASAFGVSCILFLIIVVAYLFIRLGMYAEFRHNSELPFEPKDGFLGIIRMATLAIFAYCCQPNVPAIYCELEHRSFRRMGKVSRRAMFLCFVIYILMGVCGFLTFGDQTSSNIIHNLLPRVCMVDMMVILGFLGMAAAVALAFPLNVFPIRYSVETIILYKWDKLDKHRNVLRLVITATIVMLAWITAVLIPSISIVFSLVGAFSGSIVCYIAPAMFFIKFTPGPTFAWHKAKALVVFTFGIIFLIVGTMSAIQDAINHEGRDGFQCT